jgi:WD40 repeat protein
MGATLYICKNMQDSTTCKCGNRVTTACYCCESEIVFLCNGCRMNHFRITSLNHSEIDLVKATHSMDKDQKAEYFYNLTNYAKCKNTMKFLKVSRKKHLATMQELCQRLTDTIKESTDKAIAEMDVIKINLKNKEVLISKHFTYPDNQTFEAYHELSIEAEQTMEDYDKRCIEIQNNIANSIKEIFGDAYYNPITSKEIQPRAIYGDWEYPLYKFSSKTSSISGSKVSQPVISQHPYKKSHSKKSHSKTDHSKEKHSKKSSFFTSIGDRDARETREIFEAPRLTKEKLRALDHPSPKSSKSIKVEEEEEEEVKISSIEERAELKKCKKLTVLENHKGFVNALIISKDNTIMVSGSDTSIIVWNLKRCAEIARRDLVESVNCITITSDKLYVIYGSEVGNVVVWDYNKNKIQTVFRGHSDSVNCIAITSNDQLLVSGSRDKTLRIWDLDQTKEAGILRDHTDIVKTCVISQDNKYLISGSYDHEIIVWYLQSQTIKRVIDTILPINCLALSAGNQYIFYGSWDSVLRIYSMKEKRQVAALEGHKNWITAISLSRDGKYIITCSQDKTLRAWSIDTKKPIAIFKRHREAVTCSAITYDNKYVISGSNDNRLIVWGFEAL